MELRKIDNEHGFKDYYFINRLCEIFKITKDKENNKDKIKKMSPYVTRDGYIEYVLTKKDGTKKHIQAHRIGALTFLGKPKSDEVMEVNHKDGVKSNNKISNLKWVTKKENIKHTYDVLNRQPVNKYTKR